MLQEFIIQEVWAFQQSKSSVTDLITDMLDMLWITVYRSYDLGLLYYYCRCSINVCPIRCRHGWLRYGQSESFIHVLICFLQFLLVYVASVGLQSTSPIHISLH